MESNTGFFCKIAAGAIFVLAFIGGCIWGLRTESFFLALSFWAAALLFCLLLYAAGEMLSILSRMEYYTAVAMQKTLEAEKEKDEPVKDGWTCKECGTVNPQYVVECKTCGVNKFE